tara:strand:+ start:1873 stop:2928 length:1056 start_codon:yes stop_codon:yes gene_type:complete
MNNLPSLTNRRNRRNFVVSNPAVDPATTYAGVLSSPFVAPALKLATTLDKGFVRQIDGIQSKAVISNLSSTANIQAASCTWNDGDNLTLGEQVLELTDLAVMEALCRGTLLPTWVGMTGARETMTAGSPEFVNFAMATVAAYTSQGVENGIWTGSTAIAQGFLSSTGTFDNTGYRLSKIAAGGTEAAPKATEVIVTALGFNGAVLLTAAGAFNEVYSSAVANVPAILNRLDIAFYCSPKTAGLYMRDLAVSGSYQGVNMQSTNQAFDTLQYLGIPIHVCPGMADECLVLTYEENLVVGSNLGTDRTTAQYIDAWQYDGGDEVKIAMRFGLGMQVGIPADVVIGAYDVVIGD